MRVEGKSSLGKGVSSQVGASPRRCTMHHAQTRGLWCGNSMLSSLVSGVLSFCCFHMLQILRRDTRLNNTACTPICCILSSTAKKEQTPASLLWVPGDRDLAKRCCEYTLGSNKLRSTQHISTCMCGGDADLAVESNYGY